MSAAAPTTTAALLNEFSGVPKPALQAMLGKALGLRVWRHLRSSTEAAVASPHHPPAASAISDNELLLGMIAYLSRQAAAALRDHDRQANAIALEISCADGAFSLHRLRLAAPTGDADALCSAAIELFHLAHRPDAAIASLNLRVTSIEAAAVSERSRSWDLSLSPSPAH